MDNSSLHRYFLNNGNKRIHKWIHYLDIYERHFARLRGASPVMVEIGVKGGGSLEMWREYLGPGSQIIGVDIDPLCQQHEADGIEVMIGDQSDPALIESLFERHPRIDIVLDDGSHVMEDMIASFGLMYDRLSESGVYMVEDTNTCYWEQYGGGVGSSQSFVELAKKKVDELNAVHTKGEIQVSEFTRATDFIAFYDSCVVFERRRQGERQAIITQGM